MEKSYSYAVNNIREIVGNKVICSVLKYRVYNGLGRHPILTSLSKWREEEIELTDSMMRRFISISDEDRRRAYLTKVLALS